MGVPNKADTPSQNGKFLNSPKSTLQVLASYVGYTVEARVVKPSRYGLSTSVPYRVRQEGPVIGCNKTSRRGRQCGADRRTGGRETGGLEDETGWRD